jgi:hypothetical protein
MIFLCSLQCSEKYVYRFLFNFVCDYNKTTHFSAGEWGKIIVLYWGKYSILDAKEIGCELDAYKSGSLNMNIQVPE